jgi:tight adherence protein B
MWIPLAFTFALAFGLVCGTYWLLVVRPESESRAAVSRRLRKPREAKTSGDTTLVKDSKSLSSIPLLQSAFERAGTVSSRVQALLDSADVSMTVGRFVLASFLLCAIAYTVVWYTLRQPGFGLVAALGAGSLPYLWARRKRSKRLLRFEEQFPDAIDLVARAMRAGHGLNAGLGMVADEIGAPVGREFRLIYDWQNYGMSLPEALHRFAERMPLLDARFFVTSVLTQRESGGNLSEVLDNLSKIIRERFRVKRQIRVLSAHGRITGAVLSGLPPLLAVYFFIVQPDYLAELTTDPLGVRMVIAALLLQVIGVLAIRKLVNIEY